MKPTNLPPAFEAMNTPDEDGNGTRPVFRVPGVDGWIVNGWAAAFVGDAANSFAPHKSEEAGNRLRGLFAVERTGAFVEDVSWRIPFVPAQNKPRPKCKECGGKGQEECNLGHEHTCSVCDGDGRIGPRWKSDRPGQRVYRLGDAEAIVQERCGALLDGYRVVRLGKGEEDPLAGIDENGDIVVLAMPMRGPADKPEAGK